MSLLAQMATTSVVTQRTSYGTNQTQAARDVNRVEYEQRVQGLQAELVQTQLKREQANLQAQQQSQQNQQSYAQGLYQVLQQRVAAQEQAFAGKEQGMAVQGAHAQEATAQYNQLLNQAFQLEAMMEQERGKAAQASMMVDPLTTTNVVDSRTNLQNQLQAFVQNQMQNNQAIGNEQVQNEYTNAIAEIMRRLGINDSQLTTSMADMNQSNIQSQYNANANQIAQQTSLNNQSFDAAIKGLNDAKQQEYDRYLSDNRNINKLANSQRQQNTVADMAAKGYVYDGMSYKQVGGTPLLDQAIRESQSGGTYNNSGGGFSSPSFSTPQSSYNGGTYNQGTGGNLWLSNQSTLARENILKADPNAIIKMPEDVAPIKTKPANTSKPPEKAKGKK